jgi:hypothetical protein
MFWTTKGGDIMTEKKTIYAALLNVQQEIVAPKDQPGYGYKYRTVDGILSVAKPLLKEAGIVCTLSDDIITLGDENNRRYYVQSTATLIDIATGDSLVATGVANEPLKLANMASPQITGTASTYARKRALEGLFLLDSEKDVDSKEVQDAIQNAQNDAQATERKNKGKSTNKDSEAIYNEADAVRKANINKLNAEIKRLGAKPEDVKNLAEFNFKKKSVNDMSDTEICVLAENLEKWLKGE